MAVAQRPFHSQLLLLHAFIRHAQVDGFLHFIRLRIGIGILGEDAFFRAGDHHRSEKPLRIIMQRFPAAVIINGRPACHRPAVIELPDNRSHASSAVSPEMLHAISDRFRLQKLGGVERGGKVGRIKEGLLHIVHDLSVGGRIPLMLFHHIGKDIPILRFCKRLHRLQGREGLETELRYITEIELPVLRDGLIAMPYIPVVHVSPVFRIRLVEISS